MCSSDLAQSDFFSVGTNDLIQYLFAVDRANEKVAELYTPANKAVFSVLKMIRQQVQPDPGKGPTLSICGEMASDRLFVLLLLGLGYRSFSVSMPSVPMIKYVLRKAEHIRCREVVEEMLVSGGDGLDMAPITRYLDQQLAYS